MLTCSSGIVRQHGPRHTQPLSPGSPAVQALYLVLVEASLLLDGHDVLRLELEG